MTLVSNAIGTIRNWWWFIVKGLLFIIAGIAIVSRPIEGYVSLSILFSVAMLGIGISQVIFSVGNKDWLPGWGWTFVSGIIDVVIGTYLFLFPMVTMGTLPFFVGFWLMIRSFYIMGASFDLNYLQVPGWRWLFAGGLVLLSLSVLILFYPAAAAIGIVASSGAAFLLGGILSIAIALKLRSIKQTAKGLI